MLCREGLQQSKSFSESFNFYYDLRPSLPDCQIERYFWTAAVFWEKITLGCEQ